MFPLAMLLDHAAEYGYGMPAFNVNNMEQMLAKEAAVAATDLSMTMRYAMFSLISIVPGISLLLSTIPMKSYDLVGKKMEKITLELAEKREERGIHIG